MTSSSGTATTLGLNGNERNLYNSVWASLSPATRDALPLYTSRDDKVQIGEAVKGTPGIANEWFNTMINKVGATYVTQIVSNNPYQVLEKEPHMYANILEDTFVDRVSLQDFDVNKTAQRELRVNRPKTITHYYKTNFDGQYQTTPVSRQTAVRAFTEQGDLFELVDAATAALAHSWDLDNRDMYNFTFGNAYFKGAVKELVVAQTADAESNAKALSVQIQTAARLMMSPRRDFNQDGVRSATLEEDLFLVADAATMAGLGTYLFSNSFQLGFVKLPGHLIEIDQFDNIDWAAFEDYAVKTGGIKEYTPEQKAYLGAGKLKAFLFDGKWIRAHLNAHEMGSTELRSGTAMNSFLSVAKTYATRDFANSVAIVSEAYVRPTEYDFLITEVLRNDTVTQIVFKAPSGLSYTWIPDDTATESTVSDDVAIAANDQTMTLTIETNGVQRTAEPLVVATAAVGQIVAFA